jgi:poly(A) polymerase
MKISLPESILTTELKSVCKLLDPCMLVGGVVRDSILNIESKDVDIVTLLTPDMVTEALTAEGIKVVPTGIEHGTVTAIYNNQVFEITTARRDIKTDGRHAKVVFSDSFEEDAKRRDFTFNAIYSKPNGEITDFTGGLDDLKSGTVRFIGDANSRIQEDYLRILRFFRFYARFAEGEVDEELLETIKQNAQLLRNLSAERITDEILKILSIKNLAETLKLMQDAGVLQSIGLHGSIKEVSQLPASPMLRLYALGGEGVLRNGCLVFSNKQQQYFKQISRSENIPFSEENLNEKSYFVGQSVCVDTLELLAIKKQDKQYSKWAKQVKKLEIPDFPVKGADLIKLGFPEGRELGVLLKKVEQWWVKAEFPTKDVVMKYIMQGR